MYYRVTVKMKIYFALFFILNNCSYVIHEYVYIGCFKETKTRLLPYSRLDDRQRMSASFCVHHCAEQKFKYAGIGYSYQCYCGNGTKIRNDLKLDDDFCNKICSGNSLEFCGGRWKISIYRILVTYPRTTEDLVIASNLNEFKTWTTMTGQQNLIEDTTLMKIPGKTEIQRTDVPNVRYDMSSVYDRNHISTKQSQSTIQEMEKIIDLTVKDIWKESSTTHFPDTTFQNPKGTTKIFSTSHVHKNGYTTVLPGCTCPCVANVTWLHLLNSNLSLAKMNKIIHEKLAKIKNEISITKTETDQYKRLKISATDNRTSSAVFGVVGTIFIVLFLSFFICGDCISFYQFLKKNNEFKFTKNKRQAW